MNFAPSLLLFFTLTSAAQAADSRPAAPAPEKDSRPHRRQQPPDPGVL
jgi:hypothetical protein